MGHDRVGDRSRAGNGASARSDRADLAAHTHLGVCSTYLYARNIDALREPLIKRGFEAGEIRDGSPGPRRELCIRDPDGHGHMVAELAESSIAGDPRET